jgi:hypothetical protein
MLEVERDVECGIEGILERRYWMSYVREVVFHRMLDVRGISQ